MARLLEGEAYLYRGVVYLVKGYQHPQGAVIAYPKYSAFRRSKLGEHEKIAYSNNLYWECIRQIVPLIPLKESSPYEGFCISYRAVYIKRQLESFLESELHLTGSALISESFNDVDFIVYGADESAVEKLRKLAENGVLKRTNSLLIKEYFEKHQGTLSLEDYLRLKKNTILHGYLMGIHVNLKLVELRRGYEGCIAPVESYTSYSGPVKVVEAFNPHRVPARYKAFIGNREVVVESLRELYAELSPGKYFAINARVEERKDGLYLVPDHGVLRPITRS